MCGTGTCEILVDSLRTSQRVKYINGDCVPSSSGYVAGRGNQEPDCVPSPSGSVAGRGNQEPDSVPSSSGSEAGGGNQEPDSGPSSSSSVAEGGNQEPYLINKSDCRDGHSRLFSFRSFILRQRIFVSLFSIV